MERRNVCKSFVFLREVAIVEAQSESLPSGSISRPGAYNETKNIFSGNSKTFLPKEDANSSVGTLEMFSCDQPSQPAYTKKRGFIGSIFKDLTMGNQKDSKIPAKSASSSGLLLLPTSKSYLTGEEKFPFCKSKLIGKGTTSYVKLIVSNDKCFAVKEYRKKQKNEGQKEYMKRMASEFCISSSLHHRHICETLDLIVDGKKVHLVMEYCSGGTLHELLQTRILPATEVNCCFKQLIDGVNYIHSMGVAHRDLKPGNILFNKDGQIKISDFGTSDVFKTAFETDAHLSRGLCGSKPYIAPEEFDCQEYDGREVDVWATGVVYFAMKYRSLPWELAVKDDARYQAFLETRKGDFYPIDSLEEPCRNLLNQIIEPNPKMRYNCKSILEDNWFIGIPCCHSTTLNSPVHHHICKTKKNISQKSRF